MFLYCLIFLILKFNKINKCIDEHVKIISKNSLYIYQLFVLPMRGFFFFCFLPNST